MPLVKITVQNDNPGNTKLSGVNVYLYTTGAVFVTSGVTDVNGLVTFVLPDGQYDCLFFKQGITILQPQRLTIDSALTNNFVVTGHQRVAPESLDPNLCRVSGFIHSADGSPRNEIDLRFNQLPINIISNGNLVFNDPVEAISDKKGYFNFDLIRGVKYEASVPGYIFALIVKTPNAPAVNVSDLLFPIPASIALSSNNITIPLAGGANSSISYVVTYTDLNTGKLSNDWSAVEVDYTVQGKVKIGANDTHLIITPLEQGSTSVSFVRVLKSDYMWINPPTFIGPTLNINVN